MFIYILLTIVMSNYTRYFSGYLDLSLNIYLKIDLSLNIVIMYYINPLHAEYMWGEMTIYQHFLNIDKHYAFNPNGKLYFIW